MKRNLVFSMIVMAAVVITSPCWGASANLSISTGSMGGGFYAIGGGMAEYITKHIEGVRCTAVTSGGVDENINRLSCRL